MKNNTRTYILVIAALLMGLLAGWLIFGMDSETTDSTEDAAQAEEQIIWTCSMHPHIRKNEPGHCPICGMDLIPLQQEMAGAANPMAINMSETAMKLANVQTAVVGSLSTSKVIRLNGKIQEDERLVVSQVSHIPGRIEDLKVNFTGEYVRKGQVIAEIYSPDLVTAQNELFVARTLKDEQPRLYQSAIQKLKNWKLSDAQISRIEKADKPIENFPINAESSGYVISKNVNLGDYVKKGESIYDIADLSEVWVMFDVYESDLPWVSKGNEVTFTVSSLPGKEFTGKISFVDPVIDPKTRVAKARIELKNPDDKLKPEMFVSGKLTTDLKLADNQIAIPKSAIMWTGTRSVVYVKQESVSGISFIMREVTLGPELGDNYLINQGLNSGEEIAVNGTFSIDAAAQLAGKPSMMNPQGGPAMTGHQHGSGHTPSKEQPIMDDTRQTSISNEAQAVLTKLFGSYMEIKDALVDDNLAKSQSLSRLLLSDVQKVDMSIFGGDSHQIWMDESSGIKSALKSMVNANDIGETRKYFRHLSEPFIELAVTFGPFEQEMYIQHCPMANDFNGADWISDNKEILNPYFGESMLNCGEVTRVVK